MLSSQTRAVRPHHFQDTSRALTSLPAQQLALSKVPGDLAALSKGSS